MRRRWVRQARALLSTAILLAPALALAGPGVRVDFTAEMNGPITSATASGTLGIFDPTRAGPFPLVPSQMSASVVQTAPTPDSDDFTPVSSISTRVGLEFTPGGPQIVDLQPRDGAEDAARFAGELAGAGASLSVLPSLTVLLAIPGPFLGAQGPIQFSFEVLDCGDGALQAGEQCDDGSVVLGDGCDAACQVEPGWTCGGGPPSGCSEVCGDGVVTSGEECDDGGTVAGDGCDAACHLEPVAFTPALDPFVEVADLNPDVEGTSVIDGERAVVDGELFFSAFDGLHGRELWRSDGTPGGTQLVANLHVGDEDFNGFGPYDLTAIDDTVYFLQDPDFSSPEFVWTSDGTAAGTEALASFGYPLSDSGVFTELAGNAIFRGNTAATGSELWRSDGTPAGTFLLADIDPGSPSSRPQGFTPLGGWLLFRARGPEGSELWKTDGTGAGTQLVKDILPTGDASPSLMAVLGGSVLLAATSESAGRELWRSDGTGTGTVLVKDIAPGSASSGPELVGTLPGVVLFTADDGVHGEELWRSNGTEAGTTLIADLSPGAASAGINAFAGATASAGDLVYFVRSQASTGDEIWRTDGTAAGTFLVEDVEPGPDGALPRSLTAVGDALFFAARAVGPFGGIHPGSIWVSRGNAASTLPLADLGRFDLDYDGFTVTDSFVFFAATQDGESDGDLFALPRPCCAFLGPEDGTATLLGGADAAGGLDAGFASVEGGALIAEYHEVPIADLKFALPSPAAIGFAFASDPVAFWHVELRGGAASGATLTFGYDGGAVGDEGGLTLHQLAAPGSWVDLPATLDTGADTIGAPTSVLFSTFVLGAGPASPTLALFGTAGGGFVRVSIGAVPVEVPTFPGQSAAEVAAAVAAALQADPYLASQGIAASAGDGVVTVSGGVISFQQLDDPGLSTSAPIPALSLLALGVLAVLVTGTAKLASRPRRRC